jgi:hypothetical protein
MSRHYSAAPGSTASCNIYIRRANQALRVRPGSKGKNPIQGKNPIEGNKDRSSGSLSLYFLASNEKQ